jgi:hypothetical protein
MTGVSLSFSDVTALVALLVSTFAAWKTIRFNERQKSLIESQERLNALLLEKERSVSDANKKAELSATIVRFGNNNYRLKNWNKGVSAAKRVSISFPEGNDIVDDNEVRAKFPLESLGTFDSVELAAFVSMDTKRKQVVRIAWSDDFSDQNCKTVYPTL